MLPQRRKIVLSVVCITWLAGVGSGLYVLHRYERTAGTASASPARWPTPAQITLDPHRHTLVMFVHPQCPCSAASIEQLDRLLAAPGGDRLAAYVVAVLPDGSPAAFEDSRTLRAAAAIPGVRIVRDTAGREAQRFGAETSGHVLLYGPDGRLEFSGGVTVSRGHAGDSPAVDAIAARIGMTPLPPPVAVGRTGVFGCPLTGPVRNAQ